MISKEEVPCTLAGCLCTGEYSHLEVQSSTSVLVQDLVELPAVAEPQVEEITTPHNLLALMRLDSRP